VLDKSAGGQKQKAAGSRIENCGSKITMRYRRIAQGWHRPGRRKIGRRWGCFPAESRRAGPYNPTGSDGGHIPRYPKSQTSARAPKDNPAHNGSIKAGSEVSYFALPGRLVRQIPAARPEPQVPPWRTWRGEGLTTLLYPMSLPANGCARSVSPRPIEVFGST
jgi:hypothetical protein